MVPHVLNPQLKLDMTGELHILATLLPGKKLWTANWVRPRASLRALKIRKSLAPTGN